jgi:hypothetical protein
VTGCRMLRWKDLYARNAPDDVLLAQAVEKDDVQYSCLRTCQPWGPDDSPATPESCGPHRTCWAAPRKPVV